MARATPTGTNNSTVSSPKKGRKSLSGQKLCFSPRTKVPNTNKVFVVGVSLGLILIRTERQNNKDDAFTNNAVKMIEDEDSGVASKLNIIKIRGTHKKTLYNIYSAEELDGLYDRFYYSFIKDFIYCFYTWV